MSDEFEHNPENNFSSFWPLLILTVGLLGWLMYQVWSTNQQRRLLDQQFQNEVPTITEAQNVSTRYVALMKDLVETSAKDPAAAQIVKDAIQAGLIHVQPNANGTNSTAAPAAPSK
jgi:cytoskeletal protein RodZ